MKRIALMTVAWLSIAMVPVLASGQPRAEEVRERLEVLKERLALTPEQVELVRPVLEDQARKAKALREKYDDGQRRRDRLTMARELRDIQRATDERLRKILSESQMDEIAKIRDERRKQVRARPGQTRR